MAGTGDKVKGKFNESVGKVTGDKKRELKGKAQQVKGRAKDTISETKKEIKRKAKER